MSYLLKPGDPICTVSQMSRSARPWNDVRAFFQLFRLMRRLRPDIVHTHTAKAGALGRLAAWCARVPVIVHTFHGNVLSGYFSGPVNAALVCIERTLARITDAICVVAPQQALEITERFRIAPRSKVHVIRLGLELGDFQRLNPPQTSTVNPTVCWLGRFVPIKNLDLFAKVVEWTAAAAPAVHFVIGGDGPQKHRVHELCQRFPDRVTWAGWQNDVSSLIGKCSVLLQTSINEGTPLALIQGMAAGRPFISTRAGATVNLVVGESRQLSTGAAWYDNGILCDSRPDVIGEAIVALLTQPGTLSAMSASARAASAAYDAKRLVSDVHTLYRRLLSGRQCSDRSHREMLPLRTP